MTRIDPSAGRELNGSDLNGHELNGKELNGKELNGNLAGSLMLAPLPDPEEDDAVGPPMPAAGRNVVAVIPAYNEERFVGSVVLRTLKLATTVLVVDDGSSDETAAVAEAAGAVVVRHGQNRGKGEALNTGFRAARALRPEAVVTLDADGQHLPEELGLVVAPVLEGRADIVVGSRYLQSAFHVPRHRVLGHRFFNLLSNSVSGVAVTDSQSGFRAFSPRALAALSFSSRSFSVESEMQLLAREHRLRVEEVPIVIQYLDRPKRSVLGHGLNVLSGILRLAGQYRPLFFFGVPGLVLLIAGIVWGALVVDIYRTFQTLPVGYTLLTGLLMTIGTLSLFTGLILHSVRGLLIDLVRTRE
jgi:glycosyltransferase involved in cell wall biosynthesis